MVRNKILTNNMMAVQKFVTPFLNLFLDRLHDHALSVTASKELLDPLSYNICC